MQEREISIEDVQRWLVNAPTSDALKIIATAVSTACHGVGGLEWAAIVCHIGKGIPNMVIPLSFSVSEPRAPFLRQGCDNLTNPLH